MQETLFGSPVEKNVPYSKSLLKSAIQKAVRRGEAEKAVRCTKSLLDKEPLDCMRRLMIIVLEDVLLCPSYHKLAEFTDRLSRKGGLGLTDEEKTIVLSTVADLANCQWRDFHKNNPDDRADTKGKKLTDDELALINAVAYRGRIGGMKGDMGMMAVYQRVWTARFKYDWNAERLKQYFTGEVVDYTETEYATDDDIMLEAVDFHCSPVGRIMMKKPQVIEMLQRAFPAKDRQWAGNWTSDEDMLNKVVWCLRSGVNYKKVLWTEKPIDWLVEDKIPEQYWQPIKDIYNQINGELDAIAKWYLKKLKETK